MIDADKLIKVLKHHADTTPYFFSEKRDAYRHCIDIIKNLSLETKTSDWIPCGERLPEKRGRYIATVMYKSKDSAPYDTIEAFYSKLDNKWRDVIDDAELDIIAWMPLPEPYKGEENE